MSIKFYTIIKTLLADNIAVKSMIYSNFANTGSLLPLAAVLNANGFLDYNLVYENIDHAPPKFGYYGLFTSKQDATYKDIVRKTFNDPKSKLNLVLGSPSLREGVSLKGVRQIHILEPHWNMSRLLQVMGRGYRYCSHSHLAKEARKLDVYIYLAVRPNSKSVTESGPISDKATIDLHIYNIAKKKDAVIKQFEKAIKSNSLDCNKNLVINNEGTRTKIKCKAIKD